MISQQRWFTACEHGDIIIVQQNAAYCARSQKPNGDTGLMVAVQQNHPQIFDCLLQREHSMRNAEGKSALMYAAALNNTSFIKKLMGYEMGMRDVQCKMALDHATGEGARLLKVEQVYNKFQLDQFLPYLMEKVLLLNDKNESDSPESHYQPAAFDDPQMAQIVKKLAVLLQK